MSEPVRTTFAELIHQKILEIGDGYRAKLDELGGDGPIFLRAGLVTEQGISWDEGERFHSGLIEAANSKLGRPGDTMVTTKGNSIGRAGYVPEGSPLFVYSPHLSYWRSLNSTLLSPGYLRYWAHSPEFVDQLRAMAGSTDMAPYLSLSDQRRLLMTLPTPRDQQAMADVLGALDDKIAVNDRIAATADDLCGITLEDLLLSDSEISYVPLSEISDVNKRKVVPVVGGRLRYLDISSVSIGRVKWPALSSWDDAPGRARRGVSSGDIIWSTVRPNRKSFALILDDDPALVASTGFAVLAPTKVGPAFLYEVTRRDEFVYYLESVAEGSAYPAVRAERFGEAMIPLLSPNRLDKFESIAMPLRRRVHAADVESRTLAVLRDELLPKLMSGEIRVRDAEKVVEDVT